MNESVDHPTSEETPAEATTPAGPAFPWPPRPGTSVFSAFAETWVESVFRPARFFAAMPHGGFGSALSYYLPISIMGSALMMFWRGVLVALGFADVIETFEGQPYNPGGELVEFLLSPLTATVYLLIAAGLTHVGLKVVGAAHAKFMATLRVNAFAAGPQLFLAVPLLGIPASVVWVFVLIVVGLREVHHTTTGRAIAALLLPIAVLTILVMFTIVAAIVFGAMAVSRP